MCPSRKCWGMTSLPHWLIASEETTSLHWMCTYLAQKQTSPLHDIRQDEVPWRISMSVRGYAWFLKKNCFCESSIVKTYWSLWNFIFKVFMQQAFLCITLSLTQRENNLHHSLAGWTHCPKSVWAGGSSSQRHLHAISKSNRVKFAKILIMAFVGVPHLPQ